MIGAIYLRNDANTTVVVMIVSSSHDSEIRWRRGHLSIGIRQGHNSALRNECVAVLAQNRNSYCPGVVGIEKVSVAEVMPVAGAVCAPFRYCQAT